MGIKGHEGEKGDKCERGDRGPEGQKGETVIQIKCNVISFYNGIFIIIRYSKRFRYDGFFFYLFLTQYIFHFVMRNIFISILLFSFGYKTPIISCVVLEHYTVMIVLRSLTACHRRFYRNVFRQINEITDVRV